MRLLSRWLHLLSCILLASFTLSTAGAQTAGDEATFEVALPPPHADAILVGGDHLKVLAFEEGFETKQVRGAPYQAEAVTEIVQTLADGNRIVRKTTAMVARDGEGRTRREMSFAGIGSMAPAKAPRTAVISDPVARTRHLLELDERVARRLPEAPELIHAEASKGGAPPDNVLFMRGPGVRGAKRSSAGPLGKALREKVSAGRAESLGSQVIEGVDAEGTRTRIVIPAGEIGNERPIEVVTERWYSSELQAVVLSRHSDPRDGETTFRLLNVSRGEPDRSLFEVPADFKLTDAPPRRHLRFESQQQQHE